MDSKDKPDELTSRCGGLGAQEISGSPRHISEMWHRCASPETRAVRYQYWGILGTVKGLGVKIVPAAAVGLWCRGLLAQVQDWDRLEESRGQRQRETGQCEPCCWRDPPSSDVHSYVSFTSRNHPDESEASDKWCCHSSCECPVCLICVAIRVQMYILHGIGQTPYLEYVFTFAVGEIREQAGLGWAFVLLIAKGGPENEGGRIREVPKLVNVNDQTNHRDHPLQVSAECNDFYSTTVVWGAKRGWD